MTIIWTLEFRRDTSHRDQNRQWIYDISHIRIQLLETKRKPLLDETWKFKKQLKMCVLSFHLPFWYIILLPISRCQQYSRMSNSNRTLSYPTVGKTTYQMQKENRGEVGTPETPPVWIGVWRHHWLTNCRLLHSHKTPTKRQKQMPELHLSWILYSLAKSWWCLLSRLLVWCEVGFNDHLCLLTGWYTLFRHHHNKPTIHTTCSFIIKLAHPNRKSWKKELAFKMQAPKLDDKVHEQAWAEATAVLDLCPNGALRLLYY
jgi:hypothetical protein